MRLARIPIGLTGLLIDQQFGLLPNAPVYLVALSSFVAFARQQRRLAIEMLAIATPYVIAVAAFHMWWAGLSSPARFLVPVLLPMAVPMAVCWRRQASAAGRAAMLALVAVSVGITAVLTCAGDGSLLYNTRDGYARWLDWIAPAVNLAYALPSLFQGRCRHSLGTGRDVVRCARCRMVWAPNRSNADPSRPSWQCRSSRLRWRLSARAAAGRSRGIRRSSQDRARSQCCAAPAAAIAALVRVAPFAWSVSRRDDAAFGVQDAGRRPMAAGGPLWTGRDMPPGRYRVLLDSGLNVTGELTIALGKPDCDAPAVRLRRASTRRHRLRRRSARRRDLAVDDARLRDALVDRGAAASTDLAGQADTCALRADRAVVTPAGVDVCGEGKRLCRAGGTVGASAEGSRGSPFGHASSGNLVGAKRSDRERRSRRNPSVVQEQHRLAPGELITIRLYTPPAGAVLPVTIASAPASGRRTWKREIATCGCWASGSNCGEGSNN